MVEARAFAIIRGADILYPPRKPAGVEGRAVTGAAWRATFF
jgi:hypothetical protein